MSNSKKLIQALEIKLSKSPNDDKLKRRLAGLLLRSGSYQKAETLFNEVLKNNPRNKMALWGLARLAWNKKEYEEAYVHLCRLEILYSQNLPKEHALLFSKILVHVGRLDEAVVWFDRAVSMDSSFLLSEVEFLKFLKTIQNDQDKKGNIEGKKKNQEWENISQKSSDDKNSKHFIMIQISHGTLLNQNNNTDRSSIHTNISDNDDLELSDLEAQDSVDNLSDADIQSKKIFSDKEPMNLDRIGGMSRVRKLLIKDLMLPLNNSSFYQSVYCLSNPKVLLYGPSGCGKTMMCEALASESPVSFFLLQASDFADLSFEESELKIDAILDKARNNKPAIILLEDFTWFAHRQDSIISERDSFFFRKNLLNYLNSCLNERVKVNTQIGMLAVTNMPWELDISFLEGVFDNFIFAAPPSFKDKIDILENFIKYKQSPILLPYLINCFEVISALDKHLCTGADILKLVNRAISDKAFLSVIKTEGELSAIDTDFLIALGKKIENIDKNSVTNWYKTAEKAFKNNKELYNLLWKNILETRLSDKVSDGRHKKEKK